MGYIETAAARAYLNSEAEKRDRGFPSSDKLPPFFRLVTKWQFADLNPKQLANLQLWVSPRSDCGTFKIFQHLGEANAQSIANNLESLRNMGVPEINSWLTGIGPELHARIKQNEVQPVVLVWPTCFIQGDVFDGNHRILTVLAGQEASADTKLPALIGKIPWVSWSIYFLRSMARVGDIGKNERMVIAFERMKNLNSTFLSLIGTISKVHNDSPETSSAQGLVSR